MKKFRFSAMLLSAALVLSLAGCGADPSAPSKAPDEGTPPAAGKIGFITGTGGLGDKNLNDFCYAGGQKLSAEGVQVDVVEPKDPSDYMNLQTLYSDTGEYAAVVCISFDQIDSLATTAAKYPNQKFIITDGVVEAPNVTSLEFRSEETGFQLGVLAALMLQNGEVPNARGNNAIGFVGGMDVPGINQFAAGYEAGAKYVDSEITVNITYVGSFGDPSTATELATGLYDGGTDIVFACAGGSGLGVITAAEKCGGYAFGIETNQNTLAPDNVIASGTRMWDKAVYELCVKALDGKLEGGTVSYGIKEDAVKVEREGSNVAVSEDTMKKVEELSRKVADGKLTPPTTLDGVDAFLASAAH